MSSREPASCRKSHAASPKWSPRSVRMFLGPTTLVMSIPYPLTLLKSQESTGTSEIYSVLDDPTVRARLWPLRSEFFINQIPFLYACTRAESLPSKVQLSTMYLGVECSSLLAGADVGEPNPEKLKSS